MMGFFDKIFKKNRAEAALAPTLSQEIADARKGRISVIEKGSCCANCKNWYRDSTNYGRCQKIWIKNSKTGMRLFARVHKGGVCSRFIKSEDINQLSKLLRDQNK